MTKWIEGGAILNLFKGNVGLIGDYSMWGPRPHNSTIADLQILLKISTPIKYSCVWIKDTMLRNYLPE